MKLSVLVAAALLAASPAVAEFAVIEETESMTAYRDGDQVIVLTDISRRSEMYFFARERSRAAPPLRGRVRDPDLRDAGVTFYFVRSRLLGNEMVCEKITTRPAPQLRQRTIEHLATYPCG